jgi:hypothetical protein
MYVVGYALVMCGDPKDALLAADRCDTGHSEALKAVVANSRGDFQEAHTHLDKAIRSLGDSKCPSVSSAAITEINRDRAHLEGNYDSDKAVALMTDSRSDGDSGMKRLCTAWKHYDTPPKADLDAAIKSADTTLSWMKQNWTGIDKYAIAASCHCLKSSAYFVKAATTKSLAERSRFTELGKSETDATKVPSSCQEFYVHVLRHSG